MTSFEDLADHINKTVKFLDACCTIDELWSDNLTISFNAAVKDYEICMNFFETAIE